MLQTPRYWASARRWRAARTWRPWWTSTCPSWARWRGGWSRCWTWPRSTPSRTSSRRSTCCSRCRTKSSWAQLKMIPNEHIGWTVVADLWRSWESTAWTVRQGRVAPKTFPSTLFRRLPRDVPSPRSDRQNVAALGKVAVLEGGRWTLSKRSATILQSSPRLTPTDGDDNNCRTDSWLWVLLLMNINKYILDKYRCLQRYIRGHLWCQRAFDKATGKNRRLETRNYPVFLIISDKVSYLYLPYVTNCPISFLMVEY